MLPTGISSGYAPSPLLMQGKKHPPQQPNVKFGAWPFSRTAPQPKKLKDEKDEIVLKAHEALKAAEAEKEAIHKDIAGLNRIQEDINKKQESINNLEKQIKASPNEPKYLTDEEYKQQKGLILNRDPRPKAQIEDVNKLAELQQRVEELKKEEQALNIKRQNNQRLLNIAGVEQKEKYEDEKKNIKSDEEKIKKMLEAARKAVEDRETAYQVNLNHSQRPKRLAEQKNELDALKKQKQDYLKQKGDLDLRLAKATRKFATAKVEADKAEQTHWGKTFLEIEADKKKQTEEKENKKDGIVINNYAGGASSTDSTKKADDGKKTEETKTSDAAKTGDAKAKPKTDEKIVIRSEFIDDKVLDEIPQIAKNLDKHFGRDAWFYEKIWTPNLNKAKTDPDVHVKNLTKDIEKKIEAALLKHPDGQTYAEIQHVQDFRNGKDAYGNEAKAEQYAKNIIFNAAQKIAKESLKYPEDAEKHKTLETTHQKVKTDRETRAEKEREEGQNWRQLKLGMGMATVGGLMFRFGALPFVGGSSLIGIPAAFIGGTMASQGLLGIAKKSAGVDAVRKIPMATLKGIDKFFGHYLGTAANGLATTFHLGRGGVRILWNSPTTIWDAAVTVNDTLGGAPTFVGGHVLKGVSSGTKMVAAKASQHYPTVRNGVASRLGWGQATEAAAGKSAAEKAEALTASVESKAAGAGEKTESRVANDLQKSDPVKPEAARSDEVVKQVIHEESPPKTAENTPENRSPVVVHAEPSPKTGGAQSPFSATAAPLAQAKPVFPKQPQTITQRYVIPGLKVTAGAGLAAGGVATSVVAPVVGSFAIAAGMLLLKPSQKPE